MSADEPNDPQRNVAVALDTRLEPSWSSDLAQSVWELVQGADLDSPGFRQSLAALVEEHGDEIFAELLFLLCHLRFEAAEAADHWQRIAEHRASMISAMSSPIDLRVALVSYFLDTHPLLESPTVIELKLLESARNFAFRDSLTGLFNYRFFREFLPRELWRADQYDNPLSLVVVDVDDFKIYNDHHGHEEGNVALARIAELLERTLRKVDIAVRYGGEEFVLLLPATPKTGAEQVAERVRQAIESEPMHGGAQLTVSLGVATYPADAESGEDLLRHADRAMYFAKASGKNQVELHAKDRWSHARVRTVLSGDFRQMSPEIHPLETVDLSGGGVRFAADKAMPVGALVDVQLLVSGGGEGIRLAGRVVESREGEAAKYEVAVRIVEIDAKDRRQLGTYLRRLSQTVPTTS